MIEKALFTFVGIGETLQQAADEATGKANEWLATHGWHNMDGTPAYVLKNAVTVEEHYGRPQYSYVLHFYGPAEETEPVQQRVYTGATERLR
jgi:hypothetical protein